MFESKRVVRWCLLLSAFVIALPLAAADAPAAAQAPVAPVPALEPLFLAPACGAAAKTTKAAANVPELPRLTPDVLEAAACSANQNCPGSGCFISCNGFSSCTVGATSVTCDGVTTNCPSCPTPPTNCIDPCCWCECKASGGTNIQCTRGCCLDCWPPTSCF